MEKLIELLNEFEKARIEKVNSELYLIKLSFRPYTKEDLINKANKSIWAEICSKYYGFIERLVENDKVKLGAYDYDGYHMNVYNYKDLLMLLSISDNPISDLCSYLKEEKKSDFEDLVDRNIDVAKRLASK